MADEIERKFKIDPARFLRWLIAAPPLQQKRDIVQYYLVEDPQIRIREVDGEYEMCFKYPTSTPVVRDEIEFEISSQAAGELIPRATRVLVKERYRVMWSDRWWDVDCIPREQTDLWLAEIELKTADELFNQPPWLCEEVTGRPEFTSFALATPTK